MDVLGNNIANVNTTGFKKGRATFQDLLYQQMSGASAPNGDVGGVNPKEIGLGMMIGSIDTIHTQGALQTTGVMTDLAVQGNGFFVLKNGEKHRLYARRRPGPRPGRQAREPRHGLPRAGLARPERSTASRSSRPRERPRTSSCPSAPRIPRRPPAGWI